MSDHECIDDALDNQTQTEAPALPIPKRIPRRSEKSNIYLREKPTTSTHGLSNNVIGDVMDVPSKPSKPIPRPRTRLMTKTVQESSDDQNHGTPDVTSHDSRASNNSTPVQSDTSFDLEESGDGYLKFAAPTKINVAANGKEDYAEFRFQAKSLSVSDNLNQEIPGEFIALRSPLGRSASDGAYIERSSNLIQWGSVGSFGTGTNISLDDEFASNLDVWSIKNDEDTNPPTYSPPPRPESYISVAEGNLIPIEKPPPLPPRPVRQKTESGTDRPPLPIAPGNDLRSGIVTICSGNLIVKHSIKDVGKRWCVLKDGKFSMFSDKKASNLKTTILCSEVAFIDASSERRAKFGFDLLVLKSLSKPFTFVAESTRDLSQWISTLAKSVCDSSSMYETALLAGCVNFDYGGKIYIRQGATGEWMKAWAEITNRQLALVTEDSSEEFDLRKAVALNPVNVEFYANKTDVVCPHATEEGKPFVLNMPGRALYIQADSEKVTLLWMKLMLKKAKECGQSIDDQPLTLDDVPVVVDRCIQFVSAHGLRTEGIYRHSGVNSKIAAVLDHFNKDPHNCHLSRDQFSENDVAGALKRFLRNMPEPLIKFELYQPLLHSSEITDENVKLLKYKSLLAQLPMSPNYATLKKLLGHLKVVTENSAENRMNIHNIASSFGNTLMGGSATSKASGSVVENNYDSATKEITVMMDFLKYYEQLFDIKEADLAKERKILVALETINKQLKNPPRAGDFLMEVFWEDRKSEAVNAPINTKLTAGELCRSLQEREKMPVDHFYSLHEVVFDEKLWRPVHFSEEIIPIIMRWTAWNESNICQYSSNYLCIRRNSLYEKIAPMMKSFLSISQQVRFSKEKSFKKITMEFSKLKLTAYKTVSTEKELETWKIEDIVWFVGCSPQRSSPTRFSFTFVEREHFLDKLKQHRNAFGYTVACESEGDLQKWLATLIDAQWGTNLFYASA